MSPVQFEERLLYLIQGNVSQREMKVFKVKRIQGVWRLDRQSNAVTLKGPREGSQTILNYCSVHNSIICTNSLTVSSFE